MIVVVKEYGAVTRKKGNCLLIKGNEEREICADQVKELHVYSACNLSADVIAFCMEKDIWVIFVDKYGNPLGELLPFSGGCSPIYKRNQLILADSPIGIEIAKGFLIQKIENRISHLKHILHNKRSKKIIVQLKMSVQKMNEEVEKIRNTCGKTMSEVRESLQGYEGVAGRAYFESISMLLPEELRFFRRERNANDVYNCILNYLYGILYAKAKNIVYKCRLDPYIGIMHVDSYNKPTFVYDFVESQRIICEELAFHLCSSGIIGSNSVFLEENRLRFTEEAKQIIISEFYAIMNEQCYFKKKSMTRERKMYLEMLEVAKKIGRMNEDVLAIV